MLFKFKSKACADLIMLEVDARRLLKIMLGDDPIRGIVQVADLAPALHRLDRAVAEDEASRQGSADQALTDRSPQAHRRGDNDAEPAWPAIRLAQRAAPMQQMIRRCIAEKADLVWGV